MRKIILTAFLVSLVSAVHAQKFMTRTGKVTFFSETPVENIEAFNNETAAVLDAATGEFVFQVPIKSFKFEKSLMQEHFNENYMESGKYPKADYKGMITDMNKVNLRKDGTYNVNTKGKLKIHGVTQEVSIPGTVTVEDGSLTVNTVFNVSPKDYDIKIPGVVATKIAEQIEVTVNTILEKK